jgi:lipopolysaccharide transport system ATP-binding protein
MTDLAISVNGLGKQYRVGSGPRYGTLRDALASLGRLPGRLVRGNGTPERFWALKDVSFEVKRGEVVGIIGRNGAGKSTLLKILSRITEPTEGEADIFGRVGSLLEVGTGFHPELTGRENIFLNGAILGMRRTEILRKFDEIVAFAEVEKFIDTPVKHFSSGMYMRLAFAVAAHLEPEILVVDEVLAVGDAQFQKRCLGKMGEVAKGGRTVLLVSHNMGAISLLCSSVLVLDRGRVEYNGPTAAGIAAYHAQNDSTVRPSDPARRAGNGQARFVDVRPASPQFRPDEPKIVHFRIRREDPALVRCYLSAHVVDDADRIMCQCYSGFVGAEVMFDGPFAAGSLCVRGPWLKPGDYRVHLYLLDGLVGSLDRFEEACRFQVLPSLPYPQSGPESAFALAAALADYSWDMRPSASCEK